MVPHGAHDTGLSVFWNSEFRSAIDPNNVDIKLEPATFELYRKADPRSSHQLVDSIRATNPAASPYLAEYLLSYALPERVAVAASPP